jgi:uncharacterized protein YlxP (DUF503 family)
MATVVGLLHLKLHITQAQSLKDKRRVIKGFKDRLLHGHNISVAEVGGLDDRRQAVLAIAMVGNDRQYVEGALQQVINAASVHRDMILMSREVEWL